jgi:ribonuclease G
MQWLEQKRIGETLRAGVEDSALVELHLVRASDPLPFGTRTEAIVRSKAGARLGVDCDGVEAWLIGSPQHPIGARLSAQVVRAAIPEPGQIKRAHLAEHRGPSAVPPDAQNVQDFSDAFEIEDWCDRAISGTILFGGGSLSLERTRAGLVIDVDGTGEALALNIAAAQKIASVLRLFQVGGMVLVDFVTLDNRSQRLALDAALDAALKKDPRAFERTAINGFGLVQIVRAKKAPSLMDILCGTRRHAPNIETLALRLLNEAARSKGAGTRTLTARAEIIDYITCWPHYVDALRAAVAANVALRISPDAPGHGFVHVLPV